MRKLGPQRPTGFDAHPLFVTELLRLLEGLSSSSSISSVMLARVTLVWGEAFLA